MLLLSLCTTNECVKQRWNQIEHAAYSCSGIELMLGKFRWPEFFSETGYETAMLFQWLDQFYVDSTNYRHESTNILLHVLYYLDFHYYFVCLSRLVPNGFKTLMLFTGSQHLTNTGTI